MTKNGIPESSGANVEEVAIVADVASSEAERLAAEQRAAAQAALPPSTGHVSYEIEDPNFFTSGDMEKALQKALDNQRKEMVASFARLKASASESQTSSGAAPRSPHATFVHPGSEAPLQRGGPYQWDYPSPKLVEPKYNFNDNPPVLTENTNFLDWKSLMADYLRFVCEQITPRPLPTG